MRDHFFFLCFNYIKIKYFYKKKKVFWQKKKIKNRPEREKNVKLRILQGTNT